MDFNGFDISSLAGQLNPLLLAVLAVVTIFTVVGYKKGFIRLAVSLFSMIAWMVLISFCVPHISAYLRQETDLYEVVGERISEAFAEVNRERDNTVIENHAPTIEDYSLPQVVKQMLLQNDTPEVYERLLANAFEEYVSRYLADLVIKVAAFVIAYFVVMLIMRITLLSAEFISKLPVIKGVNKAAGALAGFAEGAVVVVVAFTAATFIVGRPFYESVHTSRLLSFIYDNNPLLVLFATIPQSI